TGGDGIKLALGLLWERRAGVPRGFPRLGVHGGVVQGGGGRPAGGGGGAGRQGVEWRPRRPLAGGGGWGGCVVRGADARGGVGGGGLNMVNATAACVKELIEILLKGRQALTGVEAERLPPLLVGRLLVAADRAATGLGRLVEQLTASAEKAKRQGVAT